MTTTRAAAPARFVRAEDMRSLAHLLKRSGSCIESEIRGPSMGPTLPPGTRVRIRCGEDLTFEPGQIVAFLSEDRLIAHRLLGRGRHGRARGFLLTRGDATALCDAPVTATTVLGIVTGRLVGDEWGQVPPSPAPTPFTRAMQAIANLLLDVHPALARLFALAAFRVRNSLLRLTHLST